MATAISFGRAGNDQNQGYQSVHQSDLIMPQQNNNVKTVYQPTSVLEKREVMTPKIAYRPTQVVQEQVSVENQQYVQQGRGYQYSYGCGWGGGLCALFFGLWLAASVVVGVWVWAMNPRWAQRGNKSKNHGDGEDKVKEGCLDGAKIIITSIIVGLLVSALITFVIWMVQRFWC
jgi:hypothetical protein